MLTREQAIELAAAHFIRAQDLTVMLSNLLTSMKDQVESLKQAAVGTKALASKAKLMLVIENSEERLQAFAAAGAAAQAVETARAASARGRAAAEALHSGPGGYREKNAAIRAAWATGKYRSRDECAEKEHKGLSISFSTARKALRGTPDPA